LAEPTERTGDNGKTIRWKEKVFSEQLIVYANNSLSESEKKLYDALIDDIASSSKIEKAEHIMLLDSAIFDYLRIKRLQTLIAKEGDVVQFQLKSGRTITKANEASYLLNAITTQFRSSMKELMLTRKEVTKKEIGLGVKDFASFLSENSVDADFKDEVNKDETRKI